MLSWQREKPVKIMKSLTASRRWQGFGRAISVRDGADGYSAILPELLAIDPWTCRLPTDDANAAETGLHCWLLVCRVTMSW